MKLRTIYKIIFTLSIVGSLAFGVFVVEAGEIEELKGKIGEREKEIQELQEQAAEYKGAISYTHEVAETLKEVIVAFNLQIKQLENDIEITEKEIITTTLQIRKTELEILAKEEAIRRTREYISATLREIYEGDDEKIIELMLKYQNFSQFFNQVEYRSLLQEDLKNRLEEIKRLREKLELDKQELNREHRELESLKKSLEDRNKILEAQKIEKQNLLLETRSAEWQYKKLLKAVREKEEEIASEIISLEAKLQAIIDPGSIPVPQGGLLRWPAEGLLTQGYGSTSETGFKNSVYSFHNGIDIAASAGTSIYVADSGEVVGVGDNGRYAYGKWIAINHKNGLVTLYAHLSLQAVSVGQDVARGELVGYMGSTGFSTGSHVHFTVYASNTFNMADRWFGLLPLGGSLDPIDYL